jgi:hypothetical protein
VVAPNDAIVYIKRATTRVARTFTEKIQVAPNDAIVYIKRATTRVARTFTEKIRVAPNDAIVYIKRATTRVARTFTEKYRLPVHLKNEAIQPTYSPQAFHTVKRIRLCTGRIVFRDHMYSKP